MQEASPISRMETATSTPRVGVKELSRLLRVSPTYVKDHAKELGGVKLNGRWLFFTDQARDRLIEIWPWD